MFAIAKAAKAGIASEVTIPVGHLWLTGDLIVPPSAGGLVLFAHGTGGSRSSPRNQFVAGVLREAGVGTLLFDLLTPYEELVDVRTARLRFDIGLLAHRLMEIATSARWELVHVPA